MLLDVFGLDCLSPSFVMHQNTKANCLHVKTYLAINRFLNLFLKYKRKYRNVSEVFKNTLPGY